MSIQLAMGVFASPGKSLPPKKRMGVVGFNLDVEQRVRETSVGDAPPMSP